MSTQTEARLTVVSELFVLACLLASVPSCSTGDWHSEAPAPNEKLKIEVFWSDSGNNSKVAAKAAEATEAFQEVADKVKVDPVQDPDTPEEALKIAEGIRSDAHVLAVIGHTRSGNTRTALPFYADAGIPVLMPNATSPYALYRFPEAESWPAVDELGKNEVYARYQNAFRLPPSDVPDQVEAMRAATKKLAELERQTVQNGKPKNLKAMIVCETTKRIGSDFYTRPMCDALRRSQDSDFRALIAGYREIDLDSGDIWGLVTEIHAIHPELIIFLGYPEFARNLMQELKERPADTPISKFTFLLSDACLTPELTQFGARVYVTSPITSDDALQCNTPEAKLLRENIQKEEPDKTEPTDETYTFDAVMILAAAVKSCEQRLSRRCVLQYLETNHSQLMGACAKYQLDGGERQNASYEVYSACKQSLMRRWSVAKGGVYEDEQWKCD